MGVPDLVLVRGRDLVVIDVTVMNDGSRAWLANGRDGKVAKYRPFLGMLGLEYPSVKNSSVHGFVLGTSGKWLESNNRVLEVLGICWSTVRHTVLQNYDSEVGGRLPGLQQGSAWEGFGDRYVLWLNPVYNDLLPRY